jgi:hypothetical protein
MLYGWKAWIRTRTTVAPEFDVVHARGRSQIRTSGNRLLSQESKILWPPRRPRSERDSPRRPARNRQDTACPRGCWRSRRLLLLDIGFRIRDNEFPSSSAILPGDEFLIFQSHGCRPLVAGYFFEPKLHENGFKDADPPRLSVLDDVDLIRERLVDEFDSPFDSAFILALRIAALALLPSRIFRRPLLSPTWVNVCKRRLSC